MHFAGDRESLLKGRHISEEIMKDNRSLTKGRHFVYVNKCLHACFTYAASETKT